MIERRWYAQEGVDRTKQNGEVFTPIEIGVEMVHMVISLDTSLIHGNFLDPSCGDGNLLLCVLATKIENGIHPYEALKTIYGIEIEEDNARDCRERLAKYAASELDGTKDTLNRCREILNTSPDSIYSRITCHDTLTWDVENWKPNEIN